MGDIRFWEKHGKITPGLRRIWRKVGPAGWWRVLHTDFSVDPWKQGLPGVTIAESDYNGKKQTWRQTWFLPCHTPVEFMRMAREDFRFLPKEIRKRDKNQYLYFAGK